MKEGTAGPPEIGPYRIVTRCANAATGPVYLGLFTKSASAGSLALIHHLTAPELAAPAFVDRLSRSVDRALRLRHRCIATPYCVGEHVGAPFVASEYVPGQPWSDARARLWATGGLRRTAHVQVLLEVLAALEQAHAADFIHAGVGSSCVFFGYDGRVKLGAFGLAAALAELGCAGRPRTEPVYRAPEQQNGLLDHRADLYAVGVMLWEALARQSAHAYGGQLPPIGRVVSDVPPGLMRVCDRALSTEPAARFQDASDFRRALISHQLAEPVRISVSMLPKFVRDPERLGPPPVPSTPRLGTAPEARRGPPPLPSAAQRVRRTGAPLLPAPLLPAPQPVHERETGLQLDADATDDRDARDFTLELKSASVLFRRTFRIERQQLNELLASVQATNNVASAAHTRGEHTNGYRGPSPGYGRASVPRRVYSAITAGLVVIAFSAGWSFRSAALGRTDRPNQQAVNGVVAMPGASRRVVGVPHSNGEPGRALHSTVMSQTRHGAGADETVRTQLSDMRGGHVAVQHRELGNPPVERADSELDTPQIGIEAASTTSRERHDRAKRPALDLEFDAYLPRRRHKLRAIDEVDPY